MNAPELKSLTNPQGETMNDHIICETTEEHSHPTPDPVSTTDITPSEGVLGTNVPIQGVSGASYAPMDTSPQTHLNPIAILDDMMARFQISMRLLVTALQQTNTKAQPELADTVEQVLTQANWFYDMVKETIEENHDIESLVDDRVDDRVGSAVDEWFSYNFTLTDHCDIDDIVGDALDDKLESIVEEKLEELLSEKLANAKITVNF